MSLGQLSGSVSVSVCRTTFSPFWFLAWIVTDLPDVSISTSPPELASRAFSIAASTAFSVIFSVMLSHAGKQPSVARVSGQTARWTAEWIMVGEYGHTRAFDLRAAPGVSPVFRGTGCE